MSLLEPCQTTLRRAGCAVPRNARLAFLTGVITGVLVYLFYLTNIIIYTGDALNNTVSDGGMIWSGRWSAAWLSSLGTDFSMPLVNGLLSIFALSLLAALVVVYLELRSGLSAVLCAVTLLLYPSVGEVLKYVHNADGYMIASLLAVFSLFALDRWRFGFLLSVPLLALSLGTYQANAALVIALMFVKAVRLLLFSDREDKALARLCLRYVLATVAGLLLYYGLAKLFLCVTGFAMADYQSMSQMGRFSLSDAARNFLGCYRDFKAQLTYVSQRDGFFVSGYFNYALALTTLGLAALCYPLCQRKSKLRAGTLFLLLLLSPMLLCAIRMFNPEVVVTRMTYSVCGIYLLGISLTDETPFLWERLCRHRYARPGKALFSLAGWVILLCLVVCLFGWAVGINVDFYRDKMDYENMYAQCSAYLQTAEAAPGYERGMPVYVIGAPTGTAREPVALNAPKYYYSFMRYYLAADMPQTVANAVDDQAEAIAAAEAFHAMPAYPAPGCAQLLEGAMVVKLSEWE